MYAEIDLDNGNWHFNLSMLSTKNNKTCFKVFFALKLSSQYGNVFLSDCSVLASFVLFLI